MNPAAQDQSSDVHAASAGKVASSGGRFTNRGIIIQTLVALLEIVNQKPPFDTVTLEPLEGDDQFDFVWTRGVEKHATQVKSSKNPFLPSMIEEWAEKMADARNGEQCKLMLVGPMDTKVSDLKRKGHAGVKIQTLHVGDPDSREELVQLRDSCTAILAKALPHLGLAEGSQQSREDMINELNGDLILKAASGTPTTHEEFCRTLGRWFSKEQKETVNAYPEVVKRVNADLIRYSKAAQILKECDGTLFTKTSQGLELAKHVGSTRIDLLKLIDALAEVISYETDKTVADGVEKLLGGLLVLAVDPEWITATKLKTENGTLEYPGQKFVQNEGDLAINLLNVVLRALVDRPCEFRDLFKSPDSPDEMRFPGKDVLGRGVLAADEQHGIEVRFIVHMQGRLPKNQREHEELRSYAAQQIERAPKTKGRPYYTTDPAYQEHIVDLKGAKIGAKSLQITVCQSATESVFMDNAHNFVSPLHNIESVLVRLRGSSAP